MIDDLTPYQNAFAMKLGIILGLVFYIIQCILAYFLRKKALKDIKNNLDEGEFIVTEAKMNPIGDFLVSFPLGGFIGVYIVPFLIYPEVQRIDTIDRQYLPLCIIAIFACLSLTLFFACWKCVFTNKRLINRCVFNSLFKSFYGTEFLYYSDIKSLEYGYWFWYKVLYLLLNNKKKSFRMPGFKNIKEIQTTIEKYTGLNI